MRAESGMQSILFDFQRPGGTSWFYLSFILALAVYFRFSRILSLRNLDLIALFLGVPGLLAVNSVEKSIPTFVDGTYSVKNLSAENLRIDRIGYTWLFAFSAYLVCRCFVDLVIPRRPKIDPNLNIQGLTVLAVALLGFLTYEILQRAPDPAGRKSAQLASSVRQGHIESSRTAHPATPLIIYPVWAVVTMVAENFDAESRPMETDVYDGVARSAAILCHVTILVALVLIGWKHFDDLSLGIGMATLYLLLPLTAIQVEKVDHLLPSMFLVWAVLAYRKPWCSGVLFGFACLFVYPILLVPLWTGFYWKRGAHKFLIALLATSAMFFLVIWQLSQVQSMLTLWKTSFASQAWDFMHLPESLGLWTQATQSYRLPIFIVHMAILIATAFWPVGKNLGELIAMSVLMIACLQFWYGDRGGSYIHWYLPLLLLMVFRPNLTSLRPPEQNPAPATNGK